MLYIYNIKANDKRVVMDRNKMEIREHERDQGDDFGGLGGSVGGTPHSGRPFGLWMRLFSHSSSAAALSFCRHTWQRKVEEK